MFKLIATMRLGDRYRRGVGSLRDEAARFGTATLFRDDRVLRAMIVRDEVPPAFVEWVER